MRKVKATIIYPVQNTESRTIEIEVPEGCEPEEWIENEKISILEKALPEITDIGYLIDLELVDIENIRY